ncbi:MAG: hypothetical protein AB7E31_04410 [Desulfitobacterium sp.]
MEAKNYLSKVNEICEEYGKRKDECGVHCPLNRFNCGVPDKEDIDAAIDLVEHYEEKLYPFGRCTKCGKEFNSELISEYVIKNCPWCGKSIKK